LSLSSDETKLPESSGCLSNPTKGDPTKKALIVIDIQNDYFPGGAFTLENADEACKGAVDAIEPAKRDGWLVVVSTSALRIPLFSSPIPKA
jgi:nicotinamidase-related amidase